MLHIILVEPEIPPNTGNLIRLAANTGTTLHLVHPLGFAMNEKGLRRAGLDYHEWARVVEHADFPACMKALPKARFFAIETNGARYYADAPFQPGDALVFGSETRGLPPKVLAQVGHERVLRLPMQPGQRSINLSNAVAAVTFEAWRQLGFEGGV